MAIDTDAAETFLTTHGRVLDRLRLHHLLHGGSVDRLVAAVDAYRNDDQGYGWGLEPDLRSVTSQPGGALHALEVFAEIAPAIAPRTVNLFDWIDAVSLADGGIPFALAIGDPEGCAPFWVGADNRASSLHITAALAALALRIAQSDPEAAKHRWLERATQFCFDRLRNGPEITHALEFKYVVWFLDAATDDHADALPELERLRATLPPDGRLHVGGGLADEFVNALDFSPAPDRPVRALFDQSHIDSELDRLAAGQHADGGWPAEWDSYSPIAALEWRGWLTVRAMSILRDNDRV